MIDRGRRNLLGIAISAVDYEYAVAKIIEDAQAGRRCATTALAVHGVITGALDRAHRYRLNTFDLVTPDGQPVRWALNLLYGTKLNDRVYGPTMTLKVCKEAALQGIPVYFYGSSQQVLDKLCARLPELCPGLKIAGAHPSEFRKLSAEEQKLAADRIRESGAKIVFVGLGCPRLIGGAERRREGPDCFPHRTSGIALDPPRGCKPTVPRRHLSSGREVTHSIPGRLWYEKPTDCSLIRAGSVFGKTTRGTQRLPGPARIQGLLLLSASI